MNPFDEYGIEYFEGISLNNEIVDNFLNILNKARQSNKDEIILSIDFAWSIYNIIPKFRVKPTRYISKGDRYKVLKRQGWKCNICGKKLDYSEEHNYNGVVAHIDHIRPFSEWDSYDGDINELSNLQALCPDCNMKKHKNKIN